MVICLLNFCVMKYKNSLGFSRKSVASSQSEHHKKPTKAVCSILCLSWPYRYFLSQYAVKGDFVFEKSSLEFEPFFFDSDPDAGWDFTVPVEISWDLCWIDLVWFFCWLTLGLQFPIFGVINWRKPLTVLKKPWQLKHDHWEWFVDIHSKKH